MHENNVMFRDMDILPDNTYTHDEPRAVKQAKRNKEINVARLCNTNRKGFNERRIVRDNVGPLKTPTGQIVTTDNNMANTLNTNFSSVFTHEQP